MYVVPSNCCVTENLSAPWTANKVTILHFARAVSLCASLTLLFSAVLHDVRVVAFCPHVPVHNSRYKTPYKYTIHNQWILNKENTMAIPLCTEHRSTESVVVCLALYLLLESWKGIVSCPPDALTFGILNFNWMTTVSTNIYIYIGKTILQILEKVNFSFFNCKLPFFVMIQRRRYRSRVWLAYWVWRRFRLP